MLPLPSAHHAATLIQQLLTPDGVKFVRSACDDIAKHWSVIAAVLGAAWKLNGSLAKALKKSFADAIQGPIEEHAKSEAVIFSDIRAAQRASDERADRRMTAMESSLANHRSELFDRISDLMRMVSEQRRPSSGD